MQACSVICRKATVALPDANYLSPWCQSPFSRAQNWHFCALLPASFSRWWFLGAPSRALSAESPAERQLCCSDTRKSIGPSAPIAYAASVSPPNEAAACQGAGATKHHREKAAGRGAPKHHREKAAAGVPQSIIGKSLLAETDQNPHKEAVQKKPHTKKPCTRSRTQRSRV